MLREEKTTTGKALVIDDESDARAFVRGVLESEGWQVAEAADGIVGLEQIISSRPDLVVLNIQMPKKDGFSVWGELLAKHQDTLVSKFIMLTAVTRKSGIPFSLKDMAEYFGKAPDAYVEKPVSAEGFKAIVRDVATRA